MSQQKQLQIAIDARALGAERTGDEVYTRNIIEHLTTLFPEHTYHLLSDSAISSVPESANITHHIIQPSTKAWTLWTMPHYLRSQKIVPNILHVQYTTPMSWSGVPRQTRIATTVHDIAFRTNPRWIRAQDRAVWQLTLGASIRHADAVIAVSQCTANDIQRFYKTPAHKVHVVHNGIEERYFQKLETATLEKVRTKYRLPEQFIFYLGTLQPRKNVAMLMRAFNKLQQNTKTHLVIAGKKDGYNTDPEVLRAEQELQNPNIHFIGYVDEDDKPALYALSTVFAWPSLYEGFGLPPLEAAAMGTPIVVANTSCHNETLRDIATLVEPTADAMRQGLEDAISHPETPRKPSFSWQDAAKKTMQVYRSIT